MPTKLEAWLAQTVEDAIEPDLPICDPHHHFWHSREGHDPYLLDDLLRDVGSGHRVVQTVFVECHAMYRQEGPVEMQPVGETEFVEGIAARSKTETSAAASGIVSNADLRLGAGVTPVLEAHAVVSRERFRGVHNSAGWDPSPAITVAKGQAGLLLDAKFRGGFTCLQAQGLVFLHGPVECVAV